MALADYIYQKPVIETERLRIRPMSAADVPALTEWMPDPSIIRQGKMVNSWCDYFIYGKLASDHLTGEGYGYDHTEDEKPAVISEMEKMVEQDHERSLS